MFTLNHRHDILKVTCFDTTELKLYNLLSWLTSVWLSVWKLRLWQQFCHRGSHISFSFFFFFWASHLCWMKISPLTVKGNKKQMPSVSCNLSSAIRRWCSEEQQCSCQVTRRLHQPPSQLTGRHTDPPPRSSRTRGIFLVLRLRTSSDCTHGAVNNSCMCRQALKVAWKSDTTISWALRFGFIHRLVEVPCVEA